MISSRVSSAFVIQHLNQKHTLWKVNPSFFHFNHNNNKCNHDNKYRSRRKWRFQAAFSDCEKEDVVWGIKEDVQRMRVKELKSELNANGVDFSSVFEKEGLGKC